MTTATGSPSHVPHFIQDELSRNMPAYFLLLVGLLTIGMAHLLRTDAKSMDLLLDSGKGMIAAGLFAFQGKRTPDGNTTTTQITTPSPVMPPTVEFKGDVQH